MAEMTVTLADSAVTVTGWKPELNSLGDFTIKVRKTPEEVKLEREELKRLGKDDTRISQVRKEECSVFSYDEDDPTTVTFLPGTWPRVKGWLKAHGYEYGVIDRRNPAIRPELDYSAFEGVTFKEKQDVAIAMISKADGGIIETCTGWGKSFCIALLCKALPTLNIVVTTSSAQVVATLYEYLCKTIPGEVGILCGGKNWTAGKRVIVTTLKSLPNIPAEKVHLLLVDECHNCGWNQAGFDVMKFCFARRFGFSASPVRNDGSGKFMEALFGPTILKMTYAESVDAGMVTPMKYLMLPCTVCPKVATLPSLPEITNKRWSYWNNSARNGIIKKFVYDVKKVYDGQILIIVNTAEHAIQLHRMLPWFVVAVAEGVNLTDLRKKFPSEKYPNLNLEQYKLTKKEVDRIRGAFSKGSLRYVISTKIFRQGRLHMPLSTGMLIEKAS